MNKHIFLLSLLTLSSCLGPIRGESTDASEGNLTLIEDPTLVTEVVVEKEEVIDKSMNIDWNLKPAQMVQGTFEVQANAAVQGQLIQTSKLLLNDKVIATGGEGQYSLVATVDSHKERLPDGVLNFKVVVNDEEVATRSILLNNQIFSKKIFLARPLGEAKSNATTWLQSKVEKIPDINRDGEEDILILDDAKAYVRLSHPDLAQNYQRVWEVADGSWDSATACDVNGDGFTDIVLGSSFERGKIQVMFGPMMASKQFFNSATYMGTEKKELLPKNYPNTNIPNLNTELITYEGVGWRISCANINQNIGDELFYSNVESQLLIPSNSKSMFRGKTNLLSILSWVNNSFTKISIGDQPQIQSPLLYQLNLTHSIDSIFSKKADYNVDGHDDVFLTNIGSTVTGINFDMAKKYSVFLFGDDNYIRRSDYILDNKVFFESVGGLPISKPISPIIPNIINDLNNDGFDDVAVGLLSLALEPEAFKPSTISQNYIPHVIIYFGGKKFPDKTLTLIHPTNGSKKSRFGESVVSGDYNGDGFVDLAISAPGYDAVEHPTGEVIVFYGPGFSKHDIWTTPQGPERWFGQRMLALDYNRDGRDDIMASVFGTWGSSGFGNFELLFDN